MSLRVSNSSSTSNLPNEFFDNSSVNKSITSPTIHLPEGFFDKSPVNHNTSASTSQLPEGFFDDPRADKKARGVSIVQPDFRSETKRLQKAIKRSREQQQRESVEFEEEITPLRDRDEQLEQEFYQSRVKHAKSVASEWRRSFSGIKKGSAKSKVKKVISTSSLLDWKARSLSRTEK